MFKIIEKPYNMQQIDEFLDDIGELKTMQGKKRKGEDGFKVYNVPAAFDIETSSFYNNGEKFACMYVWQFGINGRVIMGRTWDEFKKTMKAVKDRYKISRDLRLVVYVHNLSYEFQWIRKHFEWDRVFGLRERDVIEAATTDGFVFRCSYHLSGKNLEKTAEDIQTYKVSKQSGSLDYGAIRHATTPLTADEERYCAFDVLVVMAYIYDQIKIYKGLSWVPLTNTGRVRGYCKKHCLRDGKYQDWNYMHLISGLCIGSVDEYEHLKAAFQGGFTHASCNKVWGIYQNVKSYDFTSSYPTVMLSETFPMSSGIKVRPKNEKEWKHYFKYYHCVFDITIKGLRERVKYEHILSGSKCRNIKGAVYDNGRVVSADRLTTTLTEIDLVSLSKFYEWDSYVVGDMWIYKKGYLPRKFIECVLHFYEGKTTLKGVEGKEQEYQLLKGMLNSLYGMCVTDIVREDVVYNGEEWEAGEKTKGQKERELTVYNNSYSRFLFYPWGVFITAYARQNLYRGILEAGDDYLYADTDSIKIINAEAHQDFIEAYNREIEQKVSRVLSFYKMDPKMASPRTIKGKEKPLGVWDNDGMYKRFKTLGAKRYLYEDAEGLHITVAGLSKQSGGEYISKQDRPFDFFDDGMEIPAEFSGRTTHTYIDYETSGTVVDYTGKKGSFHEMSSIHLEQSPYTMSMSDQFVDFLMDVLYNEHM